MKRFFIIIISFFLISSSSFADDDNFINLRQGIEKMANWVHKVGSRESNYFGRG